MRAGLKSLKARVRTAGLFLTCPVKKIPQQLQELVHHFLNQYDFRVNKQDEIIRSQLLISFSPTTEHIVMFYEYFLMILGILELL